MRKWLFVLVFILVLFALPLNAGAASDVKLATFKIQLWPDYDRPAVLVIYDFTPDATTALPATLSFQLPSGAELQAVAKGSSENLLNVDHPPLAAKGEYKILTFKVSELANYHVEYYLPYARDGVTRSFTFPWQADYAVKTLTVFLQEPSGARNIATEPTLPSVGPDPDGFVYRSLTLNNVEARQVFTLNASYQKDDDTLSTSTMNVQPSAPLTGNVSGQMSLTSYVPWILFGLGLILIVGGGGWYWFSSRGGARSSRSRRRPSARKQPETGENGGGQQVYCHECGKRAQPGDHFCRTCGARLRQGEA